MKLKYIKYSFTWVIVSTILTCCSGTNKNIDLSPIKNVFPNIDSIKVSNYKRYKELIVYENEFRKDSNMYKNKSQYIYYKYFDLFEDVDSLHIKYISILPDTVSYSLSKKEMNECYSKLKNNLLYNKLSVYTYSVFDEQDYYNIRNGAYWMNRVDNRFKSSDFFFYLWQVADSTSYTTNEICENKRKIRAIFLLAHSSGYECMWNNCDKIEKDSEFVQRYNRLASFYGGKLMLVTDSMLFDSGEIIY